MTPRPDEPDAPVTASRRRRGVATTYDFRRPSKLSRDHVRVLEHAGETFARQWTTLLTGAVRGSVQVLLEDVEQRTYDEWLGALTPPVVLVPFTPAPLAGTAVLHLETATALAWVDQLLGGAGAGEQAHRALTEIEQDLVLDLVERTLAEITYAFESVVARIEPQVLGLEHNPQFVQAAGATDVVIVLAFTLVLGGTPHRATMLLPLEPVVARIGASRETPEQARARLAAAQAVTGGLGGVPVEVGVRLRGATLTPSRLVALRPGDLLRLDHRAADPLELVTAGVVVAHAVSGSRGQKLACLVVDTEDPR